MSIAQLCFLLPTSAREVRLYFKKLKLRFSMLKESIVVAMYPGCISFEVALAAELLSEKYQIINATPDGQDLLDTSGLPLETQLSYSQVDLSNCKAILVPGGDPGSLVANKEIDRLLIEAHEREILIGGICAGPSVLAKAGILKGRRIAHGYGSEQLDFLKDIFKEVTLTEEPFVVDGNIMTAKPDAFIDFAVEIAFRLDVVDASKARNLKDYYRGMRGLKTTPAEMRHQKAGKYACFEFERKFFLKSLPASLIGSKNYKQIEDRYFSETNLRLRIVRSSDGDIVDRKLTQKFFPQNSDFSKTEITNLYLSQSEMDLLGQIPGYSLIKNRYKLSHGDKTFSVDEFKEPFAGLVLAEIEFETEEEMKGFAVSFTDWKDVSLEEKYSGGFLATNAKMKISTSVELVQSFWKLFSDQKWDEAAMLLHRDFVAIWPQSREKIVGAKNFIDVNRYYPGNHKIEVIHAFETGGKVITTVWIEADTGQKTFANSIFDFKDDKIFKAEEYWAEPYSAPEWRKQWVEVY